MNVTVNLYLSLLGAAARVIQYIAAIFRNGENIDSKLSVLAPSSDNTADV